MKRIYFMVLATMLCGMVAAQAPVIAFEKKVHDFGEFKEVDGKVTTVFKFKNVGMTPLVITRVSASCGCTAPSWDKAPIEPGDSGTVTATYNPTGRPGAFAKSIMVYSNATEAQIRLLIKGNVEAKPVDLKEKYSVRLGDLGLRSGTVQFNNLRKGTQGYRLMEVMNFSSKKRTLVIDAPDEFIYLNAKVFNIEPKQSVKVHVRWDSQKYNQWGPTTEEMKLTVKEDPKSQLTVDLHANITEDFSEMTHEDRMKAPILEMKARSVEVGTIKTGQGEKATLEMKNVGINNLEIRRIINNNPELTVTASKMHIEGGRSAALRIEVKALGDKKGTYRRSFSVQTNDPENVYSVVTVSWKVE